MHLFFLSWAFACLALLGCTRGTSNTPRVLVDPGTPIPTPVVTPSPQPTISPWPPPGGGGGGMGGTVPVPPPPVPCGTAAFPGLFEVPIPTAAFVYLENAFLSQTIGDLTGDNILERVMGAPMGEPPWVRIMAPGAPAPLMEFFAYDPAFRGGVRVALADVNGDRALDILTGAGFGGGPHLRAINGRTGAILAEYMAFDPNFRGGIHVAGGDVNGDGYADIVTAAGAGGGPHLRIRSGHNGGLLLNVFVYPHEFVGGVRPALVDLNTDGRPELLVVPEVPNSLPPRAWAFCQSGS